MKNAQDFCRHCGSDESYHSSDYCDNCNEPLFEEFEEDVKPTPEEWLKEMKERGYRMYKEGKRRELLESIKTAIGFVATFIVLYVAMWLWLAVF